MILLSSLFLSLISFPLQEEAIVEKMTLKEKIGQLFIVSFQGDVPTEEAKKLVQEVKVGGIVYFNWANSLSSPLQVSNLSYGLQKLASENTPAIPLFIAIDQEGGVVSRLTSGFTVFPGNQALGQTKNPFLAYKAAYIMGKELEEVGINLNFSPVVDINSNPYNPVIGIRSFSQDPEEVTLFGKEALKGYKKASLLTTLKHFPGHGDTSTDSHEKLPCIYKSLKDLEKEELLPFKELSPFADMVMTGHLQVPSLDETFATTLSEKSLSYLKNTLGFKGLIITDSLIMEGVLEQAGTVEEAALLSLQAGCDLLLLGGARLIGNEKKFELSLEDIQKVQTYLVQAVQEKRLKEERVNEAVKKVLSLKNKSLKKEYLKKEEFFVNTLENKQCAAEIATLALERQANNLENIFPLQEKNLLLVAPSLLKESLFKTPFLTLGKKRSLSFFKGLNPSPEEALEFLEKGRASDVILIFSYNSSKNKAQEALIASLASLKKPLILVVTRDPLDKMPFLSLASLIYTPFSPVESSLNAVYNDLMDQERLSSEVLISGSFCLSN